ncbi:MAG TPA: FAD-binding and (Fe-S)-binding domain-containing protein [Actinomycetes bacterium]|nr:FAD-binding and (Fe-S)-binding domain-containing protein [Actinomycetes bacterium]
MTELADRRAAIRRADRSGLSLAEAQALAAQLRRTVRGEVRFDQASRALYSTDGSNYRQVPIGVVCPLDAEDVVATVAACRRFGAPVLGRGGGTSLAGQCCNVAVVVDMSKYMHRVVELDPVRRLARVEPGIVLDRLREAAEEHRLTFGPDPATHTHCTLGGMIGNNSCGVHALMNGKTVDNIEALEVLTYDGLRMTVGPTTEEELASVIAAGGRRGQIYAGLRDLRDRYADLIRQRYPRIPRRVSGYNLDQLLPEHGFNVARALVGTESTCVLVLEATCQLIYSPPVRRLVVLGFPDIYQAGDAVPLVLEHRPSGLEGMDDQLIGYMRNIGLHPDEVGLLPPGGGWLLVELAAEDGAEAVDRVRDLVDGLGQQGVRPSVATFDDPAQAKLIWTVRESGLGATARVPGQKPMWEGWEDSAVAPDRIGDYLRDLRKLLDRHGYHGSFYGHVGQGCMHTRNDFDLQTQGGVARFRAYVEEAADLVVGYGGSLSGEHGDGQARAELLPRMFGPELVAAFGEFKAIWDPEARMNPGKVVDAYRLDENLRLGAGYAPPRLATTFRFPADQDGFADAVLRCVGVGKCRREDGGTMCPSYMVTREEQHSTRGRARLLFEMLQGEVVTGRWRSKEVHDALDLCLSCKGCKGDCPVSVDMATYKAEFLSHYYKGRLRPRTAYSLGLVWWAARAAARAPRLANFLTQAPLLRQQVKLLGGIAPARPVPPFAVEPFTTWFRRRGPGNPGGRPVLLWPDTFNNYFQPQTARAAVEVLEAAGFRVELPGAPLCCGRPLYDFGMLTLARRQLRQVLAAVGPRVAEGVPLVGLEPSCLATFRDELANLFPGNEGAKRLQQQSFTLAELLTGHADGWTPPAARRRALVQGHCHQQAVIGMGPDRRLMAAMGLEAEVLDAGCCGMAGSFGFEREHYDVAMQVGERVLLPAVRQTDPDVLVVADGFSCRTQIEQATGRPTRHLAEVLRDALHDQPGSRVGSRR